MSERIYPVEQWTDTEAQTLQPYFSNLDRPVFALTNLPEAVKGAMFARYSRYPGTLRRMFLDEFAGSIGEPPAGTSLEEGKRAAGIYERVFVGFGDDSVAQLGGAHIAAEWCSNILTKIIQRPRIASYLEQSTRYIAYDGQIPGFGFRYHRQPELGPQYTEAMDELFRIYAAGYRQLYPWVSKQFPIQDGMSEAAYSRAVSAKALDLLRGLLPAASLSHVGIYASGQAYENLVMHLLAHPLPEARSYGQMMLDELKTVIPSFVSRIERPDRGGKWIEFLEQRKAAGELWAAKLGIGEPQTEEGPSVRLLHVDGNENMLAAGLLFEEAGISEDEALRRIGSLPPAVLGQLIGELAGARENRRHKPGRGLERIRYQFEVVSDYAAFRDLQRHRLLTCQWQKLTPALGAEVPAEVEEAGFGDQYRRALEISAREYNRLAGNSFREEASYACCLGFRMRYTLDMNAREAMHLIELRSGEQGHPSYRAVAQEMHRLIGEQHPAVAQMMRHVDLTMEPRLERLLSEIRNEGRNG